MADIIRPVYNEIWASSGEFFSPGSAKISSGWVQELMPYQYENFLQNRNDTSIAYLLQKGVPEWDSGQEYIANKSIVSYSSNLYISLVNNTGVVPTDTVTWRRLTVTIAPDGTIPIASGGTGAATATDARTNLGLGTAATISADSIVLKSITGNAPAADKWTNSITLTLSGGAAGSASFDGTSNATLNVTGLNASSISSGTVPTSALNNAVLKTSATGSLILPSGTTGQRDVSPQEGYTRWNSTTKQKETFNGTAWALDTSHSEAYLLNRANHTGVQPITTVSGLQTELDSKLSKSGGVLTGDLVIPSLNGGQLAGMRNKIINGSFRVWQRGSGITITGSDTYTADRWFAIAAGANLIANRFDYNAGKASALVIAGSASNTLCDIGQRIEGANTEDLAGKVVTLSCEVYREDTGIVTWEASYANSVDNFTTTTLISSGTIAVTGREFKFAAVNFTVPTTFAHHGIEIRFKYGALAATKQAAIRRVQLEVGEVATPFEHRPYSVELALCKRYYEALSEGLAYAGFIQVAGLTFQRTNFVKFESTKRAPPTCGIRDYWTGAFVTTLRNGGGSSTDTSLAAAVNGSVDGVIGICQVPAPTAVTIVYNSFTADAEL